METEAKGDKSSKISEEAQSFFLVEVNINSKNDAEKELTIALAVECLYK